MKHTNKKGFTIVELVIVIAVIAILAAVLIPTFSNLIKKANISNDTVLAKELNTAITIGGVLETVETFEDAIAAVREQGFLLANLNTKTNGCYFVWEAQSKQFLLVDASNDFKVLYSANDDYAPIGATWNIITSDMEKAAELEGLGKGITVKRTVRATADMNALINSGENVLVYVDESVQLSDEGFVSLNKEGAVVTVDFGNAAVQGGSANADLKALPIYVAAGTMNIKNGVVSATAAFIDADGKTQNGALQTDGGVVNVEGTKFEFAGNASIIAGISSGDANFKNVTFNAPQGNNVVGAFAGAEVVLEDCKINADFIAFFSSDSNGKSTITINGGDYYAKISRILYACGGEIIVEDGNFTVEQNPQRSIMLDGNRTEKSKIVIKGGTFNGVAFENLTEQIIEDMIDDASAAHTVEKIDGVWYITVN